MAEAPKPSINAGFYLVSPPSEPAIQQPLPRPLTSFVGRDELVAAVHAQLIHPDVRLLTLTGAGGIGKTRLSIRIAEMASDDFDDGVVFVDLSDLNDPALVPRTMQHALGLPSKVVGTIDDQLARYLDERRTLVVFDNFEHILAATAFLADLLSRTRYVTLLITSRIPLHIPGEFVFAVPPLGISKRESDLATITTSPACQLFEQRTRAVRNDFRIDESNAHIVQELCNWLGGLPLAIELAAARGNVLPPAALLQQLQLDDDLLATGSSGIPARQRTMRETIQWSYDLLPPEQQRLFRELSIFASGCSFDAAESVTGIDKPATMVTGLTALLDAGLVRQDPDTEGMPRFVMLDTIRRFGLELFQNSEEFSETVNRFATWCTDLAFQSHQAFTGDGPGDWPRKLNRELGNFRFAISLLRERGDCQTALELITALRPLWAALGHQREGLQLLTTTLEMADISLPVWLAATARSHAAYLAMMVDEFPLAHQLATNAFVDARSLDDAHLLAELSAMLGNLERGLGNQAEARTSYEKALAIFRKLEDQYYTAYTLVQLAKLGDFGTPSHPGNDEDLVLAEARCQEGLALFRELRNLHGIARASNHLSYLEYKFGRYSDATMHALEALHLFYETGNFAEGAQPVENLADIAGATGEFECSARLYGMHEQLQEELGTPVWPAYRAEYEEEVARLRSGLSPGEMRTAWAEGHALSGEALIHEALACGEYLLDRLRKQPALSRPELAKLTARERDVLALLATGDTNPQIAEMLFISVPTVKGHVQNIMRKLELGSRSAVAAWAAGAGVIEPDQ